MANKMASINPAYPYMQFGKCHEVLGLNCTTRRLYPISFLEQPI